VAAIARTEPVIVAASSDQVALVRNETVNDSRD
jgi:hypothetical protein